MRPLVVTAFMSLDGVVDSPGAGPTETHRSVGWIDRYHLLVFPLLLGAGKRLFSDRDKDKQMLRLVESETYRNGIQKLVYDVVH